MASASAQALFIINNLASGLALPHALPVGDEPGKIATADATGDGKLDLVVTLPLTHRIMILPGKGDGTFDVPLYVNLPTTPGDVDVADFNLDGKPDLAVTLPERDQVAILFARGGGRFAVPQTIRVGDEPLALVIQDINLDGRPDLLVANSGDDSASQIINLYDPTNLYRYAPHATDPDGDTVTYELINAPGGMLFNETTGEILWAPTADQIGLSTVTLQASDGQGGASTQNYSIEVAPNRENNPPVIFSEAPSILDQGSALSYTPATIDPDGDSLRYRLLAGPTGTTIDPITGEVKWDARGDALSLNSFLFSRGHVSIPHTQTLSPASLTVEAAFRFDTLQYNQMLFKKDIYDPYVPLQTFRLWYLNGGLRASVAGLNSANTLVESNLDVNWNPGQGRWVHLALSFDDATGQLSLFADGQLIGSQATGLRLIYDGSPTTLGFDNSGRLYGSIANFRIWDSALNLDAIRQVIGQTVPSDAPGLLLDYRFDVGDALTVVDHTRYRHDGRRINSDGWGLPKPIHGLAALQTQSFTIGVEDGKGGATSHSFSVTVVPTITHSITGSIFQDVNGNNQQDTNETGLAESRVFIDANLNGVRDADETVAVTSNDGSYSLTGLQQGSYVLAVEPRAGFTLPAAQTIVVDPFRDSQADWAVTADALAQIRGTVSLVSRDNNNVSETDVLYSSDFSAPAPDLVNWSDKSLSTSPGGTKFLGEFTNDTVTLSLKSNADPIHLHDQLRISFDLYILKSWDGNSSPDRWQLIVDGQTIVDTTFSNVNGRQAFPQSYPDGNNAPRTGAVASNTLGYSYFGDAIYHFDLIVPHSANTATIQFKGLNLQSASDESWGLNNVRVLAPPKPISGWPVYVDANNNQTRDAGELVATTDPAGGYAFSALLPGNYRVRLDNPPGWSTVGVPGGTHVIDLVAGGLRSSINFGLVPTTTAAVQPKFLTTPTTNIAARQTYRFVNAALDPDARPLVYSLAAAPTGMSIDAQAGTLVWIPTLDQVGPQNVVLKVANDRGGVAVQAFTILVEAPNSPPVITSTPLDKAAVDEVFLYDLLAQDAEQTALEFKLESAPAGATLSADGRLQWTPPANQIGTQSFRLSVSDGHGASTSQDFAVTVVGSKENNAPELSPEIRRYATVGWNYLAKVLATDMDSDQLVFELLDGPSGMTISRDGVISWIPTIEQAGVETLRVLVSDNRGGVTDKEYTLQVDSTLTNHAPR